MSDIGDDQLFPKTVRQAYCGFLKRAKGHGGSFTTSGGTYCSSCHARVFNPHYTGSGDTEGDMEIVARLRKQKAEIPDEIKREIKEYQEKVGWKPKWVW
jgi:hypothetical protein